eukprot:TRINITY_DN16686_c0_g1_i1.p2 TRINITY_DN16686_c0_g1~~TRINITY_DN16686_c0_g1_i1.p2  ORF type:complete len:350 (-),score=97.56 TRINITY_DN16686_c0_g1_i1:1602-2609(-)
MRLRVRTVAGREAELEIEPELPLSVARAQAASALGLEAEPTFVVQGRLLTAADDDQPTAACGLDLAPFVVALERKAPAADARDTPGAAASAAMPVVAPAAASASAGASAGSGAGAGAGSGVGASADARAGPAEGDAEFAARLARQLQAEEDERAARQVQEAMDKELARSEQARQALGEDRAKELEATPKLLYVRGDVVASGSWVPFMVDTGAQMSVLTAGLAERLGLLGSLDRSAAGVAGGVGHARVLGKLRQVAVRFGELTLAVDFAVLDGTQMPTQNVAILGLDQLAVHHMVVDLDARVLRIGGVDGYVVKTLDDYEIPEEFRMDMPQRCCVQ